MKQVVFHKIIRFYAIFSQRLDGPPHLKKTVYQGHTKNMFLFIINGTKKNNQNTSLKSRDIPFYENAENDGFLQSSENEDRNKKN